MHISLKNGTPAEQETRSRVLALMHKYDLSEWLFAPRMEIDERARPHSHPVLTLNVAYRDNELLLLSTLIHESLHWFEEAHSADRDAAIDATRAVYPEVPRELSEGGSDEQSTRLHLLVCYLELQAMKQLVGPMLARCVMEAWRNHHYSWVYKTVVEDEDTLAGIIRRHGLLPKVLRTDVPRS